MLNNDPKFPSKFVFPHSVFDIMAISCYFFEGYLVTFEVIPD